MMNGGMMGGRMMLHVTPQRVPAGTVSIVALNHGTVTHELVVLRWHPMRRWERAPSARTTR